MRDTASDLEMPLGSISPQPWIISCGIWRYGVSVLWRCHLISCSVRQNSCTCLAMQRSAAWLPIQRAAVILTPLLTGLHILSGLLRFALLSGRKSGQKLQRHSGRITAAMMISVSFSTRRGRPGSRKARCSPTATGWQRWTPNGNFCA